MRINFLSWTSKKHNQEIGINACEQSCFNFVLDLGKLGQHLLFVHLFVRKTDHLI